MNGAVTLVLLVCGFILLSRKRLKESQLEGWLKESKSFYHRSSSANMNTEAPEPTTRWSVIIPARDEEANLAVLLPMLVSQSEAPLDIIVVDDGSRDGTASFAASQPGVTVIEAGPLPLGWRGKNWACSRGAELARGNRLLFLDADTRPAPQFIAAIGRTCVPGTCVTVQPWHEAGSFAERLSAFLNVAVLAGSGRFLAALSGKRGSVLRDDQVQGEAAVHTSIRRSVQRAGKLGRSGGAFGPCLACTRADYEAAGGHTSVKGEVLDHDRLAARMEQSGVRSMALLGGRLLKFRMYSGGLPDMTAGWAKSIALGAGGSPRLALLLMILWVCGLVGAASGLAGELVEAVSALAGGAGADISGLVVSVLLYGLAAATAGAAWRFAGSFGRASALLYPLHLLYFFIVFAYSLYRVYIRRSVSWKGRDLDVA
ncbi:glycosyltransferase [Paenibacillus pasadenensis]|uniref:glycosyltransferase family 2 protein n=1 Tax=Paenibacillus pasadenensis TaxID=217090 RepID=UPI00203B5E92|nr:glycosyltransferase [Paenibacillus pasadenensis]MCM3745885.1 glycosyltransferase [Paenibacillus pasadenensis]